MRTVGFIGLGDQGAPMAMAIAESGHSLHAWARREGSFDALAGAGYERHRDLAGLAGEVEIVALCLRDDADVWDLLDAQGLRERLRPGQVVVNHGTGDPGENRRIAKSLAGNGVDYLDAPVSGGRPGALARNLTTLVGGPDGAVGFCRPVFESFSRKVAHMGPVGAGQTAKLLNNALTMTNLKNAVDVFRLASSLGVDVRRLHEAIVVSSGSSAILQAIGSQIDGVAASHLQGLMRKDIEHFADAMRARGVDAEALRVRGHSGADGIVELANLLTGDA